VAVGGWAGLGSGGLGAGGRLGAARNGDDGSWTASPRGQGSRGDGSGPLRIEVDPWVGVLQEEGELARGGSEVDGDTDCADPLRGGIDDDERRGVVQLVDDTVASADSGCDEC